MYPCPCCGYDVFGGPPGSYDICPICFWEDDIVQLAFPDLAGGANGCSLMEGQRNLVAFGACNMRIKPHVRAPQGADVRNPAWWPLEPTRDRYLKWDRPEDREAWQAAKDTALCLYYWLPEYWLAGTA
jgi:Cysteine-rich CPCC